MNKEVKEIIQELSNILEYNLSVDELKTLVNEKSTFLKQHSLSLSGLSEQQVTFPKKPEPVEKPKSKEEFEKEISMYGKEEENKAVRSMSFRKASTLCTITIFILMLVTNGSTSGALFLFLFLPSCVITYMSFSSYDPNAEEVKRLMRKCETEKYNYDVTAYNNYLEALDYYEKTVISVRNNIKKQNQFINAAEVKYWKEKLKLEEKTLALNEKNSSYQDVLPSHYNNNGDIRRLIKIFENGRADSIKEAINVLEADKKAEELIDIQNKRYWEEQEYYAQQRRAAQRQQEEMQFHYQKMEQMERDRVQAEKQRIYEERERESNRQKEAEYQRKQQEKEEINRRYEHERAASNYAQAKYNTSHAKQYGSPDRVAEAERAEAAALAELLKYK